MNKLGFGFMRLPLLENGELDLEQCTKMVDAFMEAGFNYFDTAHNYLGGKSELGLKACLTSRYPRESYVLTNKLTYTFFEQQEEIAPLIDTQLEACGVDYFDYCLVHTITAKNYEKHVRCQSFKELQKLKEQGKIRHIGFSFHDQPEFLEKVILENPEVEVVQIQFNYLDAANPDVKSMGCYEVCRKYGKPVLVMEPVKGGALANLPPKAAAVLDALDGGSHASYAIRYAASQEGILKVLSGMSTPEQVQDNISFMKDFQPLNEQELAALNQVREIIMEQETVGCTACRYCVDGCPQNILIPDLFQQYNKKVVYMDHGWDYGDLVKENGKASDCVGCGQCEEICPQHLPIREWLKKVAAVFEK